MVYKRWYDRDPRLSRVVQAMEHLDTGSRRVFAVKFHNMSNIWLKERGGDNYLRMLDDNRKAGLLKSGNRKRWYDHNEHLHQAFNNLYALPPLDRRELMALLDTPIHIVEGYERYCHQHEQEPDVRMVDKIMRTCMVDGAESAKRMYTVYLTALRPNLPETLPEPKGAWTVLLKTLQEALAPA